MNNQHVTIRSASTDDAKDVAQFVRNLLNELTNGHAHDSATIENTTTCVLASDHVVCKLAHIDGVPVGVILVNQCEAIYAGGIFGEISELYVSPDHRSKGVAVDLLRAIEELAKVKGWKRLEVGAPPQPDWQRTLNFYYREGFSDVGPRLRKVF